MTAANPLTSRFRPGARPARHDRSIIAQHLKGLFKESGWFLFKFSSAPSPARPGRRTETPGNDAAVLATVIMMVNFRPRRRATAVGGITVGDALTAGQAARRSSRRPRAG